MSAEYYRDYRRTHPEYRKRERQRLRERRRIVGREDRTVEYRRQREKERRVNADHGHILESCIFRQAHKIVLTKYRPDRRTVLWDDRYEDLVGEVVVALCEGSDPHTAMREWMRGYWSRRYHHLPILEDSYGGRERPYP